MLLHPQGYRQRADRAEVSFGPLVTLAVQPLVLQLGRASLALLLVFAAVISLAVHAAVFDEETRRAVLQQHVGAVSCCLARCISAHVAVRANVRSRWRRQGYIVCYVRERHCCKSGTAAVLSTALLAQEEGDFLSAWRSVFCYG